MEQSVQSHPALQFLLNKTSNEAALRQEAENNNVQEVSRLLTVNTLSIDINALSPIGSSALHLAARHGNVEVGKILLHNKANVNIQTYTLETPLYCVIRSLQEHNNENNQKYVEFIDLLLSHGANMTVKNNQGLRPDNEFKFIPNDRPNNASEQIYKALLEQCLDQRKLYRIQNYPSNTVANTKHTEEYLREKHKKRIERNKERLYINRVHALLLYQRLQSPEATSAYSKRVAISYGQEITSIPSAFWCPYSSKMVWPRINIK